MIKLFATDEDGVPVMFRNPSKLFVTSQDVTARIFKSNFLEFGTRVHWTTPLWIYLPVCAYLLYTAFMLGASLLSVIALFVAGVFVWTFAEYTLHRFVFHFHPKSKWGKGVMWFLHGVHHDYPSDSLRLVMPPPISIPLAFLFYFTFVALMGEVYAPAFMTGFLAGYLFYDITHYALHHFPIKGNWFGKLREHHLRHHFKEPQDGFGVSSPLWDVVFRTELQPLKKQNA